MPPTSSRRSRCHLAFSVLPTRCSASARGSRALLISLQDRARRVAASRPLCSPRSAPTSSATRPEEDALEREEERPAILELGQEELAVAGDEARKKLGRKPPLVVREQR